MSQSTSQSSVKEYVVRIPKATKKKFNIMRFGADNGSDFFKTWSQTKMERENNLKEYKMAEELPKFGAGSEFGREQREEARRKRFGINVKKYRSEDQPWLLQLGGKTGKKFKGIRDGGISDNVSWYVFMQGKDGAFEAYPVDEWYNFHPIHRYKALSAEEAEEEFVRRDKIMNYFQVMYEKKLRKDGGEIDEEDIKKKVSNKSLMLSEMDDWLSDDDDEDDRDSMDEDDDKKDGSKRKRKNKKTTLNLKKKKAGGKKRKLDGGESEDSYEEESDEYNEGAEHDYISSDSSDSDQENEEVVTKELTGVDQADALRNLLASDDEDDEEEANKEDEENEEEDENKNNEDEDEKSQKEKKKKKKKKKKKNNKDAKGDDKKASDDSSGLSSDESKKAEGSQAEKKTVDEIKQRVLDNPLDLKPESKRLKMENSLPGSSGVGLPNSGDSMEEAIRKYLMRKPMTTTELLKNFMKKKDMSSEQLVTSIAEILKKVNPVKRMIKGKMYLSLKAS